MSPPLRPRGQAATRVSAVARWGGQHALRMLIAAFAIVWLTLFLWLVKGNGLADLAALAASMSDRIARNWAATLGLYFGASFLIHLLALPGGTILVLGGGYLLGVPLGAGLYYLAQQVSAPLVYLAARNGIGLDAQAILGRLRARGSPRLAALLARAKDEAFLAVVCLRLAPIVISTAVPVLAAALGLPLRTLVLGSVCVGWIKPVLVAVVGAAARSLAEVADPAGVAAKIPVLPLLAMFTVAVALFALRLWLKRPAAGEPGADGRPRL